MVIQVTAVNDAPVASAQSLSTPENTALPITLAGSDPEGYAVTYQVSGTPGHGTLTGTAPNLTYTPTTYYNGGDSLSFTVTDSEGVVSPAATVSITVTPVNQAPVALNRSLPVTLNTATAIVLTGSDVDNDPLTYTVLSQPAHGVLTGTAPNLTYTPAAGYNSTDSFTFKVNDGTVDSANIAAVYLSVGEVLPGIASEFFQNPPNLYSWPDMANLLPDDTRIDTQMSLSHGDFPAGYEDHFSSQHVAYLNITNGGNYVFSISADDNTRVYVDEALVIQQTFPQAGYSAQIFLTPGYHGIRVEFIEGYGDNYFHLVWYGPGVSGNIPASAFFRWVGYTATAAPTNLAVLPGNTVASLTWSAVGRATSYILKRSTTSGGPYNTIANLTGASHLDTGLVNGTTYYYVVSSIGEQGEGANSAEISVTPVASASLVTFTETNLNLNLLSNPTGTEIRNDGTRVRAYHFGSAELTNDVTVHGVLFTKGGAQDSFTDTAMGNWVSGYAGWGGEWSLNSITDPDYRQLLNSMVMATSSSTITIGSLIAGHTYRLQLISNNPRHGQIRVEGNTHTLNGGDNANPVVLAAQWVAGDTTLNMSMLNNDMHFNAYALHDLTATSQVADATTSTVAAQPSSVTANGIATATLSVSLNDSNNIPVAGKSVTLAKTSGPGSPVITTIAGTTDSSGLATFTVKSTTIGTAVFTATDATDGVVITQTASVTFTAAGTAVSATTSTLVAAPSSVLADGSATATLTVTLKDAGNNPVAGKTVTVAKTSGPGSPVISTIAGTTDSSGIATFTVKSTTAGTAVFTATDASDGITVNQTASVTFTAAAGLITWGAATDDTLNAGSTAFVATDVKTNGQFVAAVCNGGAGTVNGVIFTGADPVTTRAGTYLITYGASPITMQWAGSRGDVNWGVAEPGLRQFWLRQRHQHQAPAHWRRRRFVTQHDHPEFVDRRQDLSGADLGTHLEQYLQYIGRRGHLARGSIRPAPCPRISWAPSPPNAASQTISWYGHRAQRHFPARCDQRAAGHRLRNLGGESRPTPAST